MASKFLLGFFYFFATTVNVYALSPSIERPTVTRRRVFATLTAGFTSTVLVASSQAACLPGDTSKECIGVYKVPMDDRIADMVGTKEALEANAPGLNYVPPIGVPKSASDALKVLQAQRLAAEDIRSVVAAGRLEEAGIKLLNLLPRVTAAGNVLIQSTTLKLQNSNSSEPIKQLQLTRLCSQLDETVAYFGQCDVSIGQGLRGDMGSVTVAQLEILSELRDATAALDDFLALVASTTSTTTSN
jgi:hypothetical protein